MEQQEEKNVLDSVIEKHKTKDTSLKGEIPNSLSPFHF